MAAGEELGLAEVLEEQRRAELEPVPVDVLEQHLALRHDAQLYLAV